jgi:hypothetical protein
MTQFTRAFAVTTLSVASLFAQRPSVPSVDINYPGLNPNRYISLTLDGSLRHVFAANDQMLGFPLAQFLDTAGWGQIPKDEKAV